MKPDQMRAAFAARFGRPCHVVCRAPGRVNLIGEHTDYNHGFVLPIAVQFDTWVALAGADANIRACSVNLDEMHAWPVGGWADRSRPRWTSYVAGVAELLRRRGAPLGGFDALIDSEVPIGAGLSSSAALCCALAMGAAALCAMRLSIAELAALARAAEHEFARVPCGVMDQYAALAAREGAALLLDCRTLTYEHVPVRMDGHAFVVVDSGVRHELASSQYTRRQEECAQAVAYLQSQEPGVQALRDASEEQVRAAVGRLDATVAARALHVVSENRRTLAAAAALRTGDLVHLGRLMSDSHRSLRDDYQVSCAELDMLVETVSAVPGVLGARMTGGGFGGSIVALADADALARIQRAVHDRYDTNERCARIFPVSPGAGASLEFA